MIFIKLQFLLILHEFFSKTNRFTNLYAILLRKKTICNRHSKTPIELYYLEIGPKPIKQILSSSRIMYLQNILAREDGELVKRIFITQRDNPTCEDFVELVKKYSVHIGMINEEEDIKRI